MLEDSTSEWQNAALPGGSRRLTATSRIRQIRKDIARIHTIRTERVMDEALRQSRRAHGRRNEMSSVRKPFGPNMSAQTSRTQKVGRVVSNKMDKTVVVAVDFVRRHRLYHKRITRTSKFMAHDEKNECQDRVTWCGSKRLARCRRHKNWIVREVLERTAEV